MRPGHTCTSRAGALQSMKTRMTTIIMNVMFCSWPDCTPPVRLHPPVLVGRPPPPPPAVLASSSWVDHRHHHQQYSHRRRPASAGDRPSSPPACAAATQEDPNAENSRVAECRSRKVPKHNLVDRTPLGQYPWIFVRDVPLWFLTNMRRYV